MASRDPSPLTALGARCLWHPIPNGLSPLLHTRDCSGIPQVRSSHTLPLSALAASRDEKTEMQPQMQPPHLAHAAAFRLGAVPLLQLTPQQASGASRCWPVGAHKASHQAAGMLDHHLINAAVLLLSFTATSPRVKAQQQRLVVADCQAAGSRQQAASLRARSASSRTPAPPFGQCHHSSATNPNLIQPCSGSCCP